MPRAEMHIGCPNCEGGAVELAAGGSPGPEFRDRLKGETVDCHNCGDEFEVYFY